MERLIEGGNAWDDDHDDIREQEETDDYDNDDPAPRQNSGEDLYFDPVSQGTRSSYPSRGGRSLAGPKAVLADYEEAKQRMYIRREIQRAELEYEAKKNSFTVLSSREEEELRRREEEIEQNLEEMVEDDDAFFKQYREARMKQWRDQQIKRYGEVISVTRDDFLDELDNEPESVFVVLHLYETYHEPCLRLNDCLDTLAERYPQVKFLRARANNLKPNWDPVALPSLLLYKGGGTFLTSRLRITDDYGTRFTWRDIEELLVEEGVISQTQD